MAIVRALAVLLLCACGEPGLTLDVSAKEDVPQLDRLRIEVTQNALFVDQSFALADKALPQSIAVVSKGITKGQVAVVVQGWANGRVEAIARVTGELKAATSASHVAVVLERLCPGGSCGCTPNECVFGPAGSCGRRIDGCGGTRECGACDAVSDCVSGVCQPSTCIGKKCADIGAECGLALDGCGRTIDCGACASGTCGGGGMANRCGNGMCTPRTACDASMKCGSISDGCSSVVSCGSCPTGTCGGGGVPFECGCTPLTACPAGKNCGQLPDGCGGMLSCGGACTLPEVCTANQCLCPRLTQCPPDACDTWPDGCGGTLSCTKQCGAGQTCSAPDGGSEGKTCTCTGALTRCDGGCVNTSSDEANCGACGNTCPLSQTCTGGLCPCVDAGSNLDGHCCPGGWQYLPIFGSTTDFRCFRGPFDAGVSTQAEATCRIETDAGFGRAVSAVGVGRSGPDRSALPFNACGSHLLGNGTGSSADVAIAETSGFTKETMCSGNNQCLTCSCNLFTHACAQRFYCVMEPRGPRVDGPCVANAECPAGMRCTLGACVDAGVACALDDDCTGAGNRNCNDRGNAHTGLCQ